MKRTVTAWILALVLLLVCLPALADMPTEDRAGNPIELPAQVETIISLAPSITRVIVDIGMAEKLVAVDSYSAAIEGVPEGLPAFEMMTPDMEQIIAIAPDLVLVSGMSLSGGNDPFTVLPENGICVAYIPSSGSIAAILEDTLFIGRVTGNEAAAQGLNDALEGAIERLRAQTDEPVPVFFEISFPYSLGSGTFLNEMIEILGGVNIFADQEGWITVSDEAVIAAAPEIIFTNADWAEDAVAEILARDGWESIPAVKNEKVFLIEGDASSQPNHRIVLALEEMGKAFAE